MAAVLFAAFLLVQGLSVQGGEVTGVVRDISNAPRSGVRVALLAEPEQDSEPEILTSIGTTDDSGRYRLENIPPGRYHLVAGAIERPTYYPGTMDFRNAAILSIAAESVLDGIDFVILPDSSVSARGLPTILANHRLWLDTDGERGARADLQNANLEGGAGLYGNVILHDVDLRRADIRFARARNIDFTGANFENADLTQSDFRWATLHRARLAGANLSAANLQDARLTEAYLRGANLTGARLEGADLTGARCLTAEQAAAAVVDELTRIPQFEVCAQE